MCHCVWSNTNRAVCVQDKHKHAVQTVLEIFFKSHLPTAELQEYVDVVLVFKMMWEFHHMLVRQGFVELDLICYLLKIWQLNCEHISILEQKPDIKFQLSMGPSLRQRHHVPCPSGVVWTLCSVESPSQHTFCCWRGLSSHSIEQSHPKGRQTGCSVKKSSRLKTCNGYKQSASMTSLWSANQ